MAELAMMIFLPWQRDFNRKMALFNTSKPYPLANQHGTGNIHHIPRYHEQFYLQTNFRHISSTGGYINVHYNITISHHKTPHKKPSAF